MPIITLTSDLGLKDYYVSAVKGAIFSQLPQVTIVDVTHELEPFDIFRASYIVKNSYPHFPEGTVHIIGVNARPDLEAPYVGVFAGGHYFIGADNGIFSLLFDIKPDNIVELNIKPEADNYNFPVKDVFVKAACHLARGGTLAMIGTHREAFNQRTLFRPVIEMEMIRGTIIYVDSYQNVITNISKKMFVEAAKGREYSINLGRYGIEKISEFYNSVPEGEILAIFNSAGYLELAMNKGKLAGMLNLQFGDVINIQFK